MTEYVMMMMMMMMVSGATQVSGDIPRKKI
jgi:hypothetical protein